MTIPAASTLDNGASVDALYRTLFLAYADALVVADGAGRVVLANPSAATLLGYEVDELVGLGIEALVPDAVRARHAAYRESFNAAPRARPMGGGQTELVARRKDGSEVVVEIALSPLQDHGHALVVAAIRDIGAYPRVKQALQRARYSEQLARVGRLAVDAREPQKLLDEIPRVAAEALAVDVAIAYLLQPNRLELRVAGVVGDMPGEAIGDCIANRPETSLGHVLAEGRSLVIADYATERRVQVPREYLDAGLRSGLVVPLSDLGRTIGVLVVRSRRARDFAPDEVRFLESLANMLASSLQRVHSEEALNHAQRLETVGQLTGGIAHDFNNLLTVIQGNLQVLGDLPGLADNGYGGELLGAASRAARRGAELTGKLLAFSRRQVLLPSAVDAGALLHSLADMLRRTLDQRIRIEVAAYAGANVMADPGQLESALLNIAINARDAMPAGGTLRFRAEVCSELPDSVLPEIESVENGFVAIAISDSGSGMSAETRERAFEPFFTTKEAGRGTGLGLSTVYGFVKQSKGAVTLDSVVDEGTTVTLYIPRAASTALGVAADSVDADAIPEGLAVLLVEDDAEVRDVMRRFLESLRCKVLEAPSGEQALLALDGDERFDVLLSDIALGAGIRGTELAAKAQERFPELAIVLMSGFPAELIEADRDAPLAWELLRKPCSREELMQAIGRVVGAA